jgi:hypothetical protein
MDFSLVLEPKSWVFLIKKGDSKVKDSRGSFFGVSLKVKDSALHFQPSTERKDS